MSTEPSAAWEQASRVQAKYQDALMALPHVVGVAVGYATEAGQETTEPALIVMVDEKRPADGIATDDLLPRYLDGVRVDVQEFGAFTAL